MNLDPRTIIIVNIVGTLMMSVGLFAVSEGYLSQSKGIRRWAAASLVHGSGWILYSLRNVVPDIISILTAQFLLLLSLVLFLNILADFTLKKIRSNWTYAAIALTISLNAYFLWIKPDTAIRIVVISFSGAILMYAGAWVLVSSTVKKPASYWLTCGSFAIPATVLLVRAFYHLLWYTDPAQNAFETGTMQSVTFLTTYVTSVMITFGFLLMSNDRYASENEKQKAEILRNEQGLNDAQKLAKVGSWEFNLETQELYWSKEQYNIFELQDAPADKLFELCRTKIHPNDLAKLDDALEASRQSGKGVIYEHRIICKDGSIKHLLGKGEMFAGPDGKLNMLRGTVQDITEQKQAEETAKKYAILQAKSKEMEQFAYIASHDLREPLLTIKNYAELFSEEYNDKLDGDSSGYLHRISAAANRMDELMKGLLDYSRLSKVKELQEVDCNKMLAETIADLDSKIQNSSAKITSEKLPILKAYPLELKQLFQNLISNAIKFQKKNSTPLIQISATQQKGVWTFEFKDNGIGIAKENQEKIFDLFQRLNDRSEYPGSGIGLSNCKKIVELHHGTIWVNSQLEQGSSFYFTIAT